MRSVCFPCEVLLGCCYPVLMCGLWLEPCGRGYEADRRLTLGLPCLALACSAHLCFFYRFILHAVRVR